MRWGIVMLQLSTCVAIGGCHILFPFSPGTDRLDAQNKRESSVVDGPCAQGTCNPSGNGTACMNGRWVSPSCMDSVNGCGEPHNPASPGFCDPKWSECVQYDAISAPGIVDCNSYCSSRGKTCCDQTAPSCDHCITSRGYGALGFSYWGEEAWSTQEACKDPMAFEITNSGINRGQDYCDARNAGNWKGKTTAWYRCCCI
jgi:hypothetical protein